METSIEILKNKIESFSPELIEAFSKIMENLETAPQSSIPQIQRDEVMDRIKFHSEHPKTKLDFFENITELEKHCA